MPGNVLASGVAALRARGPAMKRNMPMVSGISSARALSSGLAQSMDSSSPRSSEVAHAVREREQRGGTLYRRCFRPPCNAASAARAAASTCSSDAALTVATVSPVAGSITSSAAGAGDTFTVDQQSVFHKASLLGGEVGGQKDTALAP